MLDINDGGLISRQSLKPTSKARRQLQNALSPDDYKYLSFQLWKEGIARYTEYRVAKFAAANYKPGREFQRLGDYTPFSDVADSLLKNT